MTAANGLRETIANIFYHYKWQMIFSLLGLVVGAMVVQDLASTPRYDVTVVVVSSRMQSSEEIEALATYLFQNAEDPARFTLGIESLYVSKGVATSFSPESKEGTDLADPVMPESMEVSQMVRLTAALSHKEKTLFLLDETSCRYLAELHQLTLAPTLTPHSQTHQLVELPVGAEFSRILSSGDQGAEITPWYLLVAPNRGFSNETFSEKYGWQMSIASALLDGKYRNN